MKGVKYILEKTFKSLVNFFRKHLLCLNFCIYSLAKNIKNNLLKDQIQEKAENSAPKLI